MPLDLFAFSYFLSRVSHLYPGNWTPPLLFMLSEWLGWQSHALMFGFIGWGGGLANILPGWPWIMILLISVSQVARITEVIPAELGFWTQGLIFARQVLCHLNHTLPLVLFSLVCFSNRVWNFYPDQPETTILLPQPSG
jgi:hypothetical protein